MNDKLHEEKEEYLLLDPNEIIVREEERIRERTPLVDKQISTMVESFKSTGQLDPIIIDENNVLVPGYIRLMAARKLNRKIKVIKKYGLTPYQKLQMEMQENVIRSNFTSYEYTIGLARLKQHYEKEHPETTWGRNRYSSREERGSTLENESPPSFAELHAKLYGQTRRAITERCRIGEAILDREFDEETINLFKQDKIHFTELRERKIALEKLKFEQEKLLRQDANSESQKRKKILKTSEESIQGVAKNPLLKGKDEITGVVLNKNKNSASAIPLNNVEKQETNSTLDGEFVDAKPVLDKSVTHEIDSEKIVPSQVHQEGMQALLLSIDKAETPRSLSIKTNCSHLRAGTCPSCYAQICACSLDLEKGRLIIRHSCPKDCTNFE